MGPLLYRGWERETCGHTHKENSHMDVSSTPSSLLQRLVIRQEEVRLLKENNMGICQNLLGEGVVFGVFQE